MYKVAKEGADIMLDTSLNNCCNSSRILIAARSTSGACDALITNATSLNQFVKEVLGGFISGINDSFDLVDPVSLKNLICESGCRDVLLTCCSGLLGCCGVDEQSSNCCSAAQINLQVSMQTNAIVKAYIEASVNSLVSLNVTAIALSSVRVAVDTAISATLAVTVQVKSCCSIVVTVSLNVTATADSLAVAFSQSKAVAEVYAKGYAYSNAIASALADSSASLNEFAKLTYVGCCEYECCSNASQSGKPCCDVAKVLRNCANTSLKSITAANSKEYADQILKSTRADLMLEQSDTAKVLGLVSITKAYLLDCCCCTRPPTTVTTKRISYSSSSFNSLTV